MRLHLLLLQRDKEEAANKALEQTLLDSAPLSSVR